MANTSWMYDIHNTKLCIVDRNGAVGRFKLLNEEYEQLMFSIHEAPKDLIRGWENLDFNELFLNGAPAYGLRTSLVADGRVFSVGLNNESMHLLVLSFMFPSEHFVFNAELFEAHPHI